MVFKSLANTLTDISKRLPLRVVLLVPFVLQIFGTVGVVGYLSYRNGQKAVNDLALQLRKELSARIERELKAYTEAPHIINRINASAFARGDIDIDKMQGEYLLWEQSRLFPSNSWIYCGSEKDGGFLGVGKEPNKSRLFSIVNQSTGNRFRDYNFDEKGNLSNPTIDERIPRFDSRTRPWYKSAIRTGKPNWGEIYLDAIIHVPLLSASIPVYDEGGQTIGACATDFLLSEEFTQFLKNLEIGKSGETFIMERSGTLLATSLEELSYVKKDKDVQRLKASELKNPLVRETAKYLQAHFGDFTRIQNPQQLAFTLNGRREFIQVQPFQDEYGLDWLIVVVIPEADFMEQIHANNRTTIALCLVALAVATVLGILTARWVTQPILRLNQSAKALAEGKWQQTTDIQRQDELGELAKSFNTMAAQLQDDFITLEERVKERTAELAESNQQLEIAKEKADAANQAKSTFLANMSHELRTPLNAILGFSQILTRSQRLDPDQQENINLINRSGEYLLTLINNVLNLSKIEAGKTTLNPSDFDLYGLLDEVEQMLYLKAEEKGLQLHCEYADNVPRFVHSDRTKLHQVLINLINNSIKFTYEGGIAVRVFAGSDEEVNNQQQTTLHFEIEDTGVGIAPEEIDSVFTAFGQTQSGLNSQEGTGLGLPISRKFIQLMGGDITVESQVDRGTVFKFSMQVSIAKNSDISTPTSKRNAIALAPNQPLYRILIVDDKPINRQLLIKLLNPFGFELQEAENGQKAIEIWQNWQPHLIWMDLRMPVMDGYEATKKIRSYSQGKETAILAITASVLEEEKAAVFAVGFDDFIRKPFREETIFSALEKHLEVVFIYEELEKSSSPTASQQITPADLDILPKTWLAIFYQAIVEGQIQQLHELITEIQPQYPEIASTLLDLTNSYRLDRLLELAEGGGET
ncbi:hybrid sensor histidine kinase/response regulator [Spirulina sp. 06S082]|uniref:hybrid sensor histidine kinase/response regulator n=1 Tax=Spirulina sp. 06S082 TaxID=3110248 RepID=UPI002B1F4DB2|nr:ATP-binding protein [Spirulina sp. 06S082]MEA5467623.1 ATP-binding protein [Spirulina sp. 06S082]